MATFRLRRKLATYYGQSGATDSRSSRWCRILRRTTCKARGATVIGTASERNHEYLRELPVTYGPALANRVRALIPEGITAAVDAIGGEANEVSVELLG